MMKKLIYEQKIMGINAIWIFSSCVIVYILVSYLAGELLNLGIIGFEVIYPFLVAIAVAEWGKTRADFNFNLIASQSKSLFQWVVKRFMAVFFMGNIFGLISMMLVEMVRHEMPLWEMIIIYLPPAFFLSTFSMLCGICFSGEHIATLVCGVLWIFTILTRNQILIPKVEYIYLFIRYSGDINGIWMINKVIVMILSMVFWGVIYILCKKRIFVV